MFRIILRLTAVFLFGMSATWADTLWYSGDANAHAWLPNSVSDPAGDMWVYDDFIVPTGDGAWQITAVFSNNIISISAPIPGLARWEIRSNVSPGVSGNLIAGGTAAPAVGATGRTFGQSAEYSMTVSVSVTLFPGRYWLSVAPVNPGIPLQIGQYSFVSVTAGANCVGNPCGYDGNSFQYSDRTPASEFIPVAAGSMGVLGSKIPNPSDAPIVNIVNPPSWSVLPSPPVDMTGWAINNPSSSHYSPIASLRVFRDGSLAGTATYGRFEGCSDHYSPACPFDGFEFLDSATSGGLHTYRVVATDSDPSPDTGFAEATYMFPGTTGSNTNAHPGLVWVNPQGALPSISPGASQIWFLGGPQGTTVVGGTDLGIGPSSMIAVGMADFNGDGTPDVVWQLPVGGFTQVWFLAGNQGGTYSSSANLVEQNSWRIAAVADLDGDGHPDLVWQDPATGTSQVWFMNGALGATLSGSAGLSGPNSWRIVGAADFDGNGHADLVWQDPATGVSQVWFMGGAQGTDIIGSAALSRPNAWRIARVMDFDGDGHPDLVWQDPVTGASQAWLLGGAQGTTTMAAVTLTGPTPLLLGR
jgi:hypothetical protein